MTWITLPQNNVLTGQAGHETDHDDIYSSLSTLWSAAMQSFYNVCSPTYGGGADPTGVSDSTAAIQAAINAANAAGGGVVCFPQGTYLVTPTGTPAIGLSMSGMQGVRLVGANALTTVLKKNGTGTLLNMSGPSTDTTGNTHCKYCSIENLGLNGNTNTGTLILCYYADNLNFRDIRIKDNYDICIDTAEFWDSRFYNMVIETSGSLTNGAATPNVLLRNSAAASGFGTSTDNVNQIHFVGCRFEDFRNGALWIQQGVSSTNNPNGIFLTNCKMESSFIRGGPHFSTDTASRGIFVDDLYCFSGGLSNGASAQDVILWQPQFSALNNVWISDRAATASIANGVTVNSATATDNLTLRNVRGIYNTNPTGAHINFGGTNTGDYIFDNCSSNAGTQFGGTVPPGYGANSPLNQVAGAVSDAAYSATPIDGTMGLDTTNRRLYLRENGGNWNFIPIKTVSSAVTSTTTIANSAALSTLQTATVPANDPQTASVYEMFGHGVFSTTGTPTMTFALYWGGIAGTLLASIPAITAPSGAVSLLFSYEAKVTFRSTTSCIAVLKLYFDTASATDTATVYLGGLGTTVTVTTTSSSALAVGFTWGTASASNTISCQGGYTEKIR